MTNHPSRASNVLERVERAEGVTTLVLSGELDLASLVEVREALERECRPPLSRLVLDFAAVEFIDSSALHLFVATQKQLEADGCTFEIVHVHEPLRSIFAMTHLDGVLLAGEAHDGSSVNSREAAQA